MRRYMLTIERPPSDAIAHLPRDQRYDQLRASSEHIRVALLVWIEAHGLIQEVARIELATGFHLLFMVATPHAASELLAAPRVISIEPLGTLQVDLLGYDDDDAMLPRQAT